MLIHVMKHFCSSSSKNGRISTTTAIAIYLHVDLRTYISISNAYETLT